MPSTDHTSYHVVSLVYSTRGASKFLYAMCWSGSRKKERFCPSLLQQIRKYRWKKIQWKEHKAKKIVIFCCCSAISVSLLSRFGPRPSNSLLGSLREHETCSSFAVVCSSFLLQQAGGNSAQEMAEEQEGTSNRVNAMQKGLPPLSQSLYYVQLSFYLVNVTYLFSKEPLLYKDFKSWHLPSTVI